MLLQRGCILLTCAVPAAAVFTQDIRVVYANAAAAGFAMQGTYSSFRWCWDQVIFREECRFYGVRWAFLQCGRRADAGAGLVRRCLWYCVCHDLVGIMSVLCVRRVDAAAANSRRPLSPIRKKAPAAQSM